MSRAQIPLTFRIFKGNTLLREQKLAQPVIKIGKLSSSHLRLEDTTVSRMHAVIETSADGRVDIIDLGSARGTLVNGQKINKATLRHGDRIDVGDTRIEIAMTAQSTASAPAKPIGLVRAASPRLAARTAPTPTPTPAPLARISTSPAEEAAGPIAFAADAAAAGENRAIEIAAMMGDSVIGVKHLSNPRSGKISRLTYGLFAGGAAMLIMAGVAFAAGVQNAQFNKASKEAWVQENRPVHDWRPHLISPAFDWMAFGGLAAGAFALTFGLVRVRNERRSPYFRIGSDAGVEFPTSAAPTSAFPLVAPRGDDFVVHFTGDMDGEVAIGSQRTSLGDLIASGHARAADCAPGAFQMALPHNARIKLQTGQNTFLISSVAKPRKQAVSFFGARENRVLAFFAASAIVHLGLWAFLRTLPPDAQSLSLDLGSNDARISRHTSKPVENPIEKIDKIEEPNSDGGGTGTAMALNSGKMGDQNSKRTQGQHRIKATGEKPQLSRDQAIAQARTGGILGALSRHRGSPFSALTGTGDFTVGLDDATVLGGLIGDEAGPMAGGFGFGPSGFGPGGGGTGWGTIGTGNYNTIGNGNGTGPGFTVGSGRNLNRTRKAAVPTVRIGHATTGDGLDKNIIRRYVRRKLSRIKYCYEKQLLVKPGLSGTVLAEFKISPQGVVLGSQAEGITPEVSSCVAQTISTIRFPKPKAGPLVEVRYPFTFRPSGR